MSVHERFMAHMKPSTHKKRSSYKIYNAINKYGAEHFYVETLEENIPLDKLDEKEIEYIAEYDSYNNGYNSTPGGDGRTINKLNNEDELLELAKSGVSPEELSIIFDVHKATIFRTCHKLGFYFRVDQKEIIELVDKGYSNIDVSKILGCHPETVSRALKRAGKRRRRLPLNKRENFDYDSMFEDYYNQMPMNDICKKYDIQKQYFNVVEKIVALSQENRYIELIIDSVTTMGIAPVGQMMSYCPKRTAT